MRGQVRRRAGNARCGERDQPARRGLHPRGARPAPRAGAAALVLGATLRARDARRLRARKRADRRGIRGAAHLDAVYLDLHGAMVAEHVDDADGELLRRVRQSAARGCRSSRASTSTPTSRRDGGGGERALLSFRTYPHVDMADSGARPRAVCTIIGSRRPAHALEQIDFLMPLTSQSTLVEPMRSLMDEATRSSVPLERLG